MFDIGFSEVVVIAVVALIVIGPEKLPKTARTLGHLFGRLQRYVNDVKADISREMELEELRKLQANVQSALAQVNRAQGDVAERAEDVVEPDRAMPEDVAHQHGNREADEQRHRPATPVGDHPHAVVGRSRRCLRAVPGARSCTSRTAGGQAPVGSGSCAAHPPRFQGLTHPVPVFILRCKKSAAYTPATLAHCPRFLEDVPHV